MGFDPVSYAMGAKSGGGGGGSGGGGGFIIPMNRETGQAEVTVQEIIDAAKQGPVLMLEEDGSLNPPEQNAYLSVYYLNYIEYQNYNGEWVYRVSLKAGGASADLYAENITDYPVWQ